MANYYEEREHYDPYRDAHTAVQPVQPVQLINTANQPLQPVQPVQPMHANGFEQGEFSPAAPGSKKKKKPIWAYERISRQPRQLVH